MKKKLFSALCFLALGSSASFAKLTAGTGFSAPNVNGTSNVGNPQVGDIIFETNSNSFYGYGGSSPGWLLFGGAGASQAPTSQVFKTSGPGTYTTPSGVLYLRIKMVGGGAGGWGSGTAAGTSPQAGGATTFGVSTANGGTYAAVWNYTAGGNGGTASLGTGPTGTAVGGASGGPGQFISSSTSQTGIAGGAGGSSYFGGAGAGGGTVSNHAGDTAGRSATANSGSGGGGGGGYGSPNQYSGTGGGAGGFVEAVITSPAATYSYTVGVAGTAGGAGTFGDVGGAGGAGYIIVEEFYH